MPFNGVAVAYPLARPPLLDEVLLPTLRADKFRACGEDGGVALVGVGALLPPERKEPARELRAEHAGDTPFGGVKASRQANGSRRPVVLPDALASTMSMEEAVSLGLF
jgi:hypothetical protein